MLPRALAGGVAAIVVAFAARRAGSLSSSGAVAAAVVGTLAVATGWAWGAALILYFVALTVLTRIGRDAKQARTAPVVEKGGRRDAAQVLANGGAFALLALAAALVPDRTVPIAAAAALGALAASASDSFATEIGTLLGGTPRSLLGFAPVPPGTSGAVSAAGSLAMLAGAAFVALAARALGLPAGILPVLLGGIAGALADSLLGGTIQERRWCPVCERATERRVHDCGEATVRIGGIAWMDNDAVNFASTLVGAAVGALVARG